MENSNSSSEDDPDMVFMDDSSCANDGIKQEVECHVNVKEEVVEEEAVDSSDMIYNSTVLPDVLVPFEVITLPDMSQAIIPAGTYNGTELSIQQVEEPEDEAEENNQVEYQVENNSNSPETIQTGEETQLNEVIEENVIMLSNGTYAYVHSEPREGCSSITLDDGSTAYITYLTVTGQEMMEEETVVEETVQMEERTHQVNPDKKPKQTFKCNYAECPRVFRTFHHLKVHERSHTGARPYLCPEPGCLKAFATDYSRKAHIRTHTGEKPYHCNDPHCNKSFKTSGDLQKHRRTHTGEKPFMCPVAGCDRSFTTSYIRKVHIRTHTGEKPYVCTHPGCDKSFASATNFKNHTRIHSGEKPFVCEYPDCQKRFTEYSSLYKHNLVHSKARSYHCEMCNRSYRQVSSFNVHKRTFHGIMTADDGTEIVVSMDYLNLTNRQKKRRLKSLGINIEEEPKRVEGSSSQEESSAIQADSDGVSQLELKSRNDVTAYNDHIRKYFTFLKPFVCEYNGCEKRFTEYSSLRKHHLRHSKNLVCGLCGETFARAKMLSKHKQAVHNLFETDDGAEVHVSHLVGLDASNVKNVLSTVLSLDKDENGFVTFQSTVNQLSDEIDDENQIYILTEDNLDETLQTINEVTGLEADLDHLAE
ncbi:zinc finger protein 76 isoform X3 [Nilaparvata lugens]|uniref:zinc finger protein 76 isoform X4 n=1 Tax=Nilaparvata lugens TaxID=108931 RepID=UPI00193D18AE|nr:zinc finger protein 76 isoform X4 [Nilaparvata lugens]XP_039280041.1 zinc finger protein 76 isoform X3 [Nilaparvata lugens]